MLSEEILFEQSIGTCPHCGGHATMEEPGRYVCTDCGRDCDPESHKRRVDLERAETLADFLDDQD